MHIPEEISPLLVILAALILIVAFLASFAKFMEWMDRPGKVKK